MTGTIERTMTTRDTLRQRYIDAVGYDIFEDDPSITEAEVTTMLDEIAAEAARHR